MEDSGGASGSGDSDWGMGSSLILGLVISITSATPTESGATSQWMDSGASEVKVASDQFQGLIGPILGEWSPERFARMCSEF